MPSDLLDSKNIKNLPMTSFDFHHSMTSSPFSLINLSSTKTPAPSLGLDHPGIKMTKRTSRARKKFTIGNNALNKDIENLEEIQHINKGRWTNEEHFKFTQAIEMFPKGVLHRWRKVSDWVGSRTVLQSRTHAQKYFKNLATAALQKNNAPAVARQDPPLGSTTRQSRIMGVAIGLLDMKSQSQADAGLNCENMTESVLEHHHTIDVILEESNMTARIENDPGPENGDFQMEHKSTTEGPASGAWMMSSFSMSSNLSAIWPSSESPQHKGNSIMSTPIFSKEDRIPSVPSCTSLALRSTSKLQVRVLMGVFILD